MERLTDPCWENLDPWECCGQDKFCNRDCHEAGGCTNGCIVPKLYVRLAGYEDTCLEPWQADAAKSILEMAFEDKPERAERIRELMWADRDGRVAVLPCKVGDILYRVFAGEIFEHRVGSMKYFAIQGRWDIETYPFCPCVESSIGKTVFLSREEAERARQEMEGKDDG